MKIALSHPTGNNNVKAILSAFEEDDILAIFNTTISINPKSFLVKMMPSRFHREILRRSFPIPPSKIESSPITETTRLVFQKFGLKYFVRDEIGVACVDKVYRKLDHKVSIQIPELLRSSPLKAIYAYEDASLESFQEAKKYGLKCIYDLPIAYWETKSVILEEEAKRLPDWANTLGGGIHDSLEKKARKAKELELADIVIVPSQFVKDSLPPWAKDKKVIISHFGSPDIKANANRTIKQKTNGDTLRVLFVGSMGQRKGLGDLFEAIRILERKDIELVVLGSLLEPLNFYKSQLKDFTFETGRSNDQVLELMRSCDVFCLPSLAEGRALVMQEAMSQGLPIIITPNTGGEDLIIEGETGFLIPTRSPEKIAEKLTWFLDNRDKIPAMGKKAQAHAKKYTWQRYGDTIVNGIRASIN